jgi:hypothetical protein
MSLEQPAFSFDQANPPTPTRTPTSPSFDASFQTPKFESSFYDPRVTWDTADPSCSPSLLRTPKPISFETPQPDKVRDFHGPLQGGQASYVQAPNGDAAVPATPKAQSRTTAQSPGIGYTPNFGNNAEASKDSPLTLDTSTSFRSAGSIQTPPPTTTSATKQKARKKKVQEAQPTAKAARPAKAPRPAAEKRMSVPLAPRPPEHNGGSASRAEERQVPQQLASLDFSPDVLGYNLGGPATAPAYPQQKLFWDSEINTEPNIDFSHDMNNPFDAFAVNSNQNFDVSRLPSDTFLDFTTEDVTPVASFAQQHTGNVQYQPHERPRSTGNGYNGVDPSLLFSSPSRLAEPKPGPSAQSRVLTEESLQPYAYQVQEAKREKSYGGISKSRKRRKPSVDSPAVTAALETLRGEDDRRPTVRRSMTDSFIPGGNRASSSSRPGSMHGRSSPLKRMRESSRRPTPKPSVSLSIDEFGRARLVGAAPNASNNDAMDVDDDSADESNPSSASGFEDPDDMITSFAPRLPKLGRFNSSASHSQKSSNTSLYSDYQPQLPEPNQRPAPSGSMNPVARRSGGRSLQPLREATSMEEEPDSEAETVMDSEDGGDLNAQVELRKIMQSRNGIRGKRPQHHVHSPHKQQASFAPQNNMFLDNLSPTTMTDPDLATPTSSTSNASDNIRCVCSNPGNDGQMIQCESCRNWLHVPCTGVHPQRLPNLYLCLFCTGATPAVRGGRVRDPSRRNAPASPSGQKAPRFR